MNVEPTVAAIFLVSGANDIVRGALQRPTTTYEERLAMRGYVDGLAESWEKTAAALAARAARRAVFFWCAISARSPPAPSALSISIRS